MENENGEVVRKVPLLKAVQGYGVRKLGRDTGVSPATVNTTIHARRVPTYKTAQKMAAALGFGLSEIAWPLGYRAEDAKPGGPGSGQIVDAPRVPPRRETPNVDLSGVYEDGELRAEIEALVEREVQRRMTTRTAAQTRAVEAESR